MLQRFSTAVAGPIRRLKPVEKVIDVMPCYAKCTAESYDLKGLKFMLQENYPISPFVSDDLVHAKMKIEGNDEGSDVFFFESGSFVFWPSNDPSSIHLIEELIKPFETGPIKAPETEELSFRYDQGLHKPRIESETLVLPSDEPSIKAKLAFSNGIADSVKLATLERLLQEYIAKVKDIPTALCTNGKINLTREQVLHLIGELLHFRSVLNLRSELLDTPELYWSEPDLEQIYLRTSRLLETRTRINILNRKLDYANEMAQLLRSHLSEQHSLKLEWGIIALIAVEVAFELFHAFKF